MQSEATFTPGQRVIFTDSDSDGLGTLTAIVVRPLTEDEADEEVGPMFVISFADGSTKDAFEDELVVAQ